MLLSCPVCALGRERAGDYVRARTNLPADSADARLNTGLTSYPHQAQAVAAVVALLKRQCGWLTLVGGYGAGKTTLLCAALNHLGDAGIVGGYWTTADLVQHLRDGIATDGYRRRR